MAKLKPERLLALGAERLTELLVELAGFDNQLEKRLEMLTATNSERLKKVRSQISGLKRIKRFYDGKSVRRLREKIELALQALQQLEIEPRKGFELVSAFYETDNAVYGCCDDSSGLIADLYKCRARDLLIQFGSECDDKSWLANKVFELNQVNDYGIRDGILRASCEFLPESNVRILIDRYCKLAVKAAEEFIQSEDEPGNRQSYRFWSAASELAAGIKDGSLHEMAYRSQWGDGPLHSEGWNEVAGVYLAAGYPNAALDRLGNIGDDVTFKRQETEDLRIAAHKAIGKKKNKKEIANILRQRLFHSPSSKTLDKLDDFLDPIERQSIVDELVTSYIQNPMINFSFLEFVLQELEVEIAEAYLLERSDQIDGDLYYQLGAVANLFVENKSPLAATLILRAMADSVLQRGISKYYSTAAGYIRAAASLAAGISDWQGCIDHDGYLESLRTQHARKTAFWGKMS